MKAFLVVEGDVRKGGKSTAGPFCKTASYLNVLG